MNKKEPILIIGAGVVGNNVGAELIRAGFEVDFHDPDRGLYGSDKRRYEFAFVCVPTNSLTDNSNACDTSIVRNVVSEWRGRVKTFIIKSTVTPGTTASINRAVITHDCVFSPEYYGGTQHANTPHAFQIIGSDDRAAGDRVAELYKNMYTGYARIHKVSTQCAEMVKYAENTWLAMQVTFFQQFARITEDLNIDNDIFREALLLDERISRSHSFVYRDHPYYDSHCLNKDVPAIAAFCNKRGVDASFIEAIIATNEKYKAQGALL
jgi:nucleotide sugar dehydrogenase